MDCGPNPAVRNMSDTLRLLRVLSLVIALVAMSVAAAVAVGRVVGGFDPPSTAVLAAAILLAFVVALRSLLSRLADGRWASLPEAATTIEIAVPVAASSDPDKVVAVLRRVATANQHLRSDADVELAELSGTALQFVLRAVVADPGRARSTASELRLAVLAGLRGAGIALAHDQIDVHMRDLDGLKAALATVMAERARQTAEKAAERQARTFSEPALRPSNDDR